MPPLLPLRENIAGVTMTPVRSAPSAFQFHITIRNSWLGSGIQSVNVGGTSPYHAASSVTLSWLIFQKPNTGVQPPTRACVVATDVGLRNLSNLYFEDMTAAPVGRG